MHACIAAVQQHHRMAGSHACSTACIAESFCNFFRSATAPTTAPTHATHIHPVQQRCRTYDVPNCPCMQLASCAYAIYRSHRIRTRITPVSPALALLLPASTLLTGADCGGCRVAIAAAPPANPGAARLYPHCRHQHLRRQQQHQTLHSPSPRDCAPQSTPLSAALHWMTLNAGAAAAAAGTEPAIRLLQPLLNPLADRLGPS